VRLASALAHRLGFLDGHVVIPGASYGNFAYPR
jgi:hypothetical protein